MTALIIIAAILFLLAVIMNISVIIDISYIGGILDYKVRYLFFQIFPFKKFSSKRKKKKNKKKSEKADKKETNKKSLISRFQKKSGDSEKNQTKPDEENTDSNTADLIEKANVIKDIIECSADDIRKSAEKISVNDLYVSFFSRNEDAYVCAVNYGILNGIVYNITGIVCSLFKTTIKSISVGLGFNRSGNIYDFSFSLKLKFGTGIKTALTILARYAMVLYKKSKEN